MSADRPMSRRDFLRLRPTERGKVLEVSCHAMFMRCADARVGTASPPGDWEPWMGEPPAVIVRPSVDEIVTSFERALQEVQILRLRDPEWLHAIDAGSRVQAAIAAFQTRGGAVETEHAAG